MHRSPAHGTQTQTHTQSHTQSHAVARNRVEDPAGPQPAATRQAIDHFATLLETSGLAPALAHLAAITGYRHAALLRREAEATTAVAYVDRADPKTPPPAWPPAVLDACFMRDGRGRVVEAAQLAGRRPGSRRRGGRRRGPLRQRAGARCRREAVRVAVLVRRGPARREAREPGLAARSGEPPGQAPRACAAAFAAFQAARWRGGEPWLSVAGEEDPGSALDDGPGRARAGPPRRS
ncbi:MAG: hypothetical protein U1F25_00585 [Rubrivivax sp.]